VRSCIRNNKIRIRGRKKFTVFVAPVTAFIFSVAIMKQMKTRLSQLGIKTRRC